MHVEEKLPASAATQRFEQMRGRILDAASTLINQHGIKGMTLADVGQIVGLNTTSVTYYFKRKDLLAAAVFEHSIGRLEAMVAEASAEADPRARVAAYLKLNFDLRARVREGSDRPITVLSDMRAMAEPLRTTLVGRYQIVFRLIREFFGPAKTDTARALRTVRAHVLIENIFWLPAWLHLYSIGDFDRVRARLFEIFDHGIAVKGAAWAPDMLEARPEIAAGPDAGYESFLHAATRLINERGYRGASVERIASELNVTKGSFYHHLEAKDDLVLDCFRRSYSRASLVQRAADRTGGDQWHRLSSAIATLLDVQFSGPYPLLRTTAFQALPSDLRGDVLERSNRMARRFAGTMIDGISEGSIRAIDPLIASQAVMAMLDAAYDLRSWASALPDGVAVAYYASTLATGLFDDPS